uniref:Uncharacterized protein n=1 Tax=Euplotes crassus TaxID=5936 RepID=A0A7S3K910_EUPCR
MVTGAEDVTVEGNVVWFQHIGGVWMKKSHNTRFVNNVVAGMGTRHWSGETRLDEIAAFNFCNKDQNCRNLTVTGNIAAGGQRVGFAIPTTCSAGSSEYANNTAHSVEHGSWLLKNSLCTSGTHYYGNFKVYKTIEEGIIGYQGFGNIEVSNIETLDCGIGFSPMSGVNQDNNFLTLKDSVIMGESLVLPQDSGSYCIALHGMWGSSATRGGKQFPEVKLSNLPYHKIKSYANWYTEGHHTNVTFKNWASGTRQNCATSSSAKQRLIFLNPSGADHAPVERFVGTKFINVHDDAMTFISDPNPGWAVLKDCGIFPCTAPDNVVFKFEGSTFSGTNTPSFSDAQFQIIPTNPGASELITNCIAKTAWNGFLCKNPNIAQLVFESLDSDTEDRTISPINYFGIDRSSGNRNSFNNTLNSFMDHCWDDHYTCQKRLSRFPGIIQTNNKYEIYFTGTTPGNTRYTLEGADATDYALARIDFSQSVLYKVFTSVNGGAETEVKAQAYNRTLGKPGPLNISNCGDSRYEQQDYIYEFTLRRNCTVFLRGQEHLVGLVRLKMSLSEFFEDDFVNKLAFALGITTDQIKIVGVSEGSVVVNYQILSAMSDTSSQQRNLIEMAQMLASKHAAGTLDLGAEILDLVNQVISSNGSTVSSGTGNYSKKEIHPAVYAILALSCIALIVGIIYGLIKMLKMGKVYKEIHHEESVVGDDVQKQVPNELEFHKKDMQIEEVKS